jgi:hypothetical protein
VRDAEVVIASALAVGLAAATLVLAVIGRAGTEVRAATTITLTETEPASQGATKTQAGPTGPEEVSFSGNGDVTLPPIRVPRKGTTLRWTNDGAVFSLFSEKGALIDSVAPQGTTFLPPGRHVLEIIASGNWTMTIAEFKRIR